MQIAKPIYIISALRLPKVFNALFCISCPFGRKVTKKSLHLHKHFLLNNLKITLMGKFINEFKEFAVKGNAVDMAVGVIIGGAFGKIVSSIVDDIIMPPIGWLIGGVKFTDLKFTLPQIDLGVEKLAPVTINYGNFIQTCFDFIIIAFCVFLLVKGINRLARKKDVPAKEEPKAPEPTNEEKLLAEIRDLLKNKE